MVPVVQKLDSANYKVPSLPAVSPPLIIDKGRKLSEASSHLGMDLGEEQFRMPIIGDGYKTQRLPANYSAYKQGP